VAILSLSPATPPALGQVSGGSSVLSGRYRLTLGFGPSCNQSGVSVMTVLFDVAESPALHTGRPGIEVSGRPIAAAEAPLAQFVLLRRQDALEGAIGMIYGETLQTLEGLRVSFSLLGWGTAEAATPAARASGTALGNLMLSRPGDEAIDSLGFCTARDHTWSLVRE
jgi:hypothetical protein